MGVDLAFPEDRTLAVHADDGATLHVSIAGDGPVVALVHGTLVSSGVMGPLARRLLDCGFTVAGVDLRGHGRSTTGTEKLTIDRYARDIAEVIAAVPNPVTLVGHSAGGMAALAYAEQAGASERLTSLVLISASAVGIAGWKERIAAPLLFNGLLGWLLGRPRLGRAFARPLFGAEPGGSTLEAVRRAMAASSPTAKRAAPRAVFDFDLRAGLPRVTVPVLVIYGGRDGSVRPALATQLVDALPDARPLSFPDAGHMVVIEEAEAVADAIVQFLRSAR